MLNLIKKDFLFTKFVILFSLLYCVAVPIILLFDEDGIFFADFLIPLVLVSVPLLRIMTKEDTKSGMIFLKTLPYSSFVRVGARFLFMLSLLVISDMILGVAKQFVFKSQDFGDAIIQSLPVFAGFAIYYAVYMTIYYWKGHFATQICVFFLLAILIVGRNLMNEQVIELVAKIMSNKVGMCLATVGIMVFFYLISCILDQRKKIDK